MEMDITTFSYSDNYFHQQNSSFHIRSPVIDNDFYELLYYPTHVRAQSYLIGIMLGYWISRYENSGKSDFDGMVRQSKQQLL